MNQVDLDSYMIELSKKEFLHLLDGIAGSTHAFASSFAFGIGGFPDVTSHLKNSWTDNGVKYIQAVLSQIDDEELRNLFYSFGEQIQKLYDLDNQLVATVADFFNLPTPKTRADCYKIARSMNKSMRGPFWANELEYQRLTKPMREAVETANDIKQEIDNRLQALLLVVEEAEPQSIVIFYPSPARVPTDVEIDLSDEVLDQLAEELFGDEAELAPWQYGEQRANDLVDGVVGYEDLVRAIQILHLALRYQATGIQASKAYKELGIKYEALKQERKAIDCYTKAMEVYTPEARLFLWRGELYYKLSEWDKAQQDIEQALSLQSSLGWIDLFKDEQELAEEYLTKLAKIRGSD
ncbi:MAG: hypothetical protein HYR94_06655 [Chloroflexi bacterium]|nr:hypothetical protein [Chloroflexota bacterium]